MDHEGRHDAKNTTGCFTIIQIVFVFTNLTPFSRVTIILLVKINKLQ